MAWEFRFGKVPNGQVVCHACDNPACCNPSHLWIGTGKENSEDMVKKGRQSRKHTYENCPEKRARGERHSSAKLTAEKVAAIRASYKAGGASYYSLAVEYDVKRSTIRDIVVGKTWNPTA